jgi:hypothetical protein
MKMRRWTLDEFETVLTHPDLSATELARVLQGRSRDAIELVRIGIQRFFNRQPNAGFLSSMLLQRMKQLYPDV